jgi:hypothetical protein
VCEESSVKNQQDIHEGSIGILGDSLHSLLVDEKSFEIKETLMKQFVQLKFRADIGLKYYC